MTTSQLAGEPARLQCPGFVRTGYQEGEPAGRGEPPAVRFSGSAVVFVDDATGQTRQLSQLGTLGSWSLMATFEDSTHGPVAVFEELGSATGYMAFVSEAGPVLVLGKTLEPTQEQGRSWYRGHQKDEVMPGRPDVLRSELLRGGNDPSPEEIRACFPPVRRAFFEGIERPHTFVGTFESADVVPIYYRDVPMVSRVPPGIVAPETEEAMTAETLWEGLVGGWLPVVRTVYPYGDDHCWEVITFADPDRATFCTQPVWYRYAQLTRGELQQVKYIDSYVPYPASNLASPADFYHALLRAQQYWQQQLGNVMRLTAPDEWLEDFCRHALVLERVTRWADHPKYGVVERAYAGAEHDGFQDTLTSTVTCALEWGLFPAARRYLAYYLENFVRPDGTLKYRGPELGKYGVMLTCIAQYCDYTRDHSLLVDYDQKIQALVAFLVRRWEESRTLHPSDPAYGAIRGHHEADITFLTPNVTTLDYDQPYLSNSAEAWRGLRDIGSTWTWAGEAAHQAEMAQRGRTLLDVADKVLQDARTAVDRTWLEKDGTRGLPIIAGSKSFYWEAPYRSRPESYDENRVWSELFHSCVLSRNDVRDILEIAAERGGTNLGIFTNRRSVVGFLVAEATQALIKYDFVPEALLVLYAHAFHAHTAGTWTALECVDMDRARAAHNPYCVPAQLTVPTIAKWLLVFEDPIDRTVTLAQGAPRAWFEHGRHFGVEGAPTRWGRISYHVTSRVDDGYVEADMSLPALRGADLSLRARLPSAYVIGQAEVVGSPGPKLAVDGDVVRIPRDLSGRLKLRILVERAGAST